MYTSLHIPTFFVHDRHSDHKEGQEILHRYLCEAKDIFEKELTVLSDKNCEFTEEDELRLFRMLTLIIEARKAWEEEEKIAIC